MIAYNKFRIDLIRLMFLIIVHSFSPPVAGELPAEKHV